MRNFVVDYVSFVLYNIIAFARDFFHFNELKSSRFFVVNFYQKTVNRIQTETDKTYFRIYNISGYYRGSIWGLSFFCLFFLKEKFISFHGNSSKGILPRNKHSFNAEIYLNNTLFGITKKFYSNILLRITFRYFLNK